MDGYRVKLDLSTYFKDSRSKSLIHIDPVEVNTISRLKKYIRKLFYIPDEIELYVAGDYIPSSQCIRVIRDEDTIEIRSVSSNSIESNPLEEPFNKLEKSPRDNVNDQKVIVKKKKKRKREIHGEECEIPVEVNKSDFDEYVAADCTSTLAIPKKKKRKSSKCVIEVPGECNEETSFICNGKEEEKQTAREKSIEKDLVTKHVSKRRRRRRKKKSEELFSSLTPCLSNPLPIAPIAQSFKPQLSKNVEDVKLHLRFSDSEEEGENISLSTAAILDISKEGQQKEKHNIKMKENNLEDFAEENSRNAELEDSVCELMETEVPNGSGNLLTNNTNNIEKGNINSIKVFKKELFSQQSNTCQSISKAIPFNVNELNKEDLTHSGSTSSDTKSNTACGNMHKRIRNRGKRVIINKGMGVTLAHLMKENRGNFVGGLDKNPSCPVEPIVPCVVLDLDQASQKDNKDQRYKDFPIIENYPRLGDFLAFKILKLNHKYEPCLSDYMKGTVCNCNEELQSKVSVRVLEGASELKKTIGKFDLEGEEDNEGNENDNILELEWKEFVEPRLMYP